MSQTLLVTGASGHLGQRVLELLLESGEKNIIATTRTPEKLAAFAARGVTVRAADFDDTASLVAAFTGADRLLLISTDALDRPGRRLQQHQNAVAAAKTAGVKHILYTSLTNPEPTSPILLAGDHYGTEQAIIASGLGYTILRNNVYTEMLIDTAKRAIATGQLVAAAADGKTGYVTREDCARAAAAALAASFDGQRILDVTGPTTVSQADIAAIAQDLSGKPVTYVAIPHATLVDGMVSAGLPRPIAEVYASFDAGITAGTLDVASNAVESLTGKVPTSVKDFLISVQDAFAPSLS